MPAIFVWLKYNKKINGGVYCIRRFTFCRGLKIFTILIKWKFIEIDQTISYDNLSNLSKENTCLGILYTLGNEMCAPGNCLEDLSFDIYHCTTYYTGADPNCHVTFLYYCYFTLCLCRIFLPANFKAHTHKKSLIFALHKTK